MFHWPFIKWQIDCKLHLKITCKIHDGFPSWIFDLLAFTAQNTITKETAEFGLKDIK